MKAPSERTRSEAADGLLKAALVKGFLLGCEARGLVSAVGRLGWLSRREARSYWAGCRMTLAHTGSALAFDVDFLELTVATDPFVTASALHRRLCAARHEGGSQ